MIHLRNPSPRVEPRADDYQLLKAPAWHWSAACDGDDLFERAANTLDRHGRTDQSIVDAAIAVCQACPVLTVCDQAWRTEEDGSSDLRWGIRAGLTPKQRAQAAKETVA